MSQRTSDQTITPPRRAGERSTESPWRTPSIRPTRRSAIRPAGTTRRTTRSAASGKATTSTAPTSAPRDNIRRNLRRPRDRHPADRDPRRQVRASRPRPSSATTVRPSKMRSTATEEMVALKRAPVSRVAAKTRTSSPARNGRMLLAMNPIATACHSAAAGRGPPDSSRSRRRQRTMRMGKVSVATGRREAAARDARPGCDAPLRPDARPGATRPARLPRPRCRPASRAPGRRARAGRTQASASASGRRSSSSSSSGRTAASSRPCCRAATSSRRTSEARSSAARPR